MIKKLLFIFWIIPIAAVGQYHITGKVLNLIDKKPVANASVFLSNTSTGAKSNDDGTYTINNVRGGQYELVVSIIGYASYKQSIMVNSDLSLPDIEIIPQSIELREVKIHPDKHWAEHYDMFRKEFIGTSEYARQCKILNPQTLSFQYDEAANELSANSADYIEVENKALGYKVKFLLNNFTKNYKTGFRYYEGPAYFEDLPGKKSAVTRWAKNRLNVYRGSSMHFLRSVIGNQVQEQGFKIERLIRKPNPEYKGGFANQYIETLVTTPLSINDYAMLTDVKGQYALSFKDCLYIMFNKNPETEKDKEVFMQYQTSLISFDEQYAYFDNNGVIINPQSVVFEGEWGKSSVAELLPVDYEPR